MNIVECINVKFIFDNTAISLNFPRNQQKNDPNNDDTGTIVILYDVEKQKHIGGLRTKESVISEAVLNAITTQHTNRIPAFANKLNYWYVSINDAIKCMIRHRVIEWFMQEYGRFIGSGTAKQNKVLFGIPTTFSNARIEIIIEYRL
jgi:hypothetical protein